MSLAEPFNTCRLAVRLLYEKDLDAVYRQFSDPDMCRFLSEPPVNREQALEIINFFQDPDQDGYLRYGLFSRGTGEFIGTCGFHHWDREQRQVELGYDIWKEHWRQGYATEALNPLIRICFERLGVEQVYVLVNEANQASIRTAEKAGFRRCPPCRPLDEPSQVCMKLARTEWERNEDRT